LSIKPFFLLVIGMFVFHSCAIKKRTNRTPTDKVTVDAPHGGGEYGTYTSYVRQYAPLAMREMKRTGIPASIKLAQAILESGGGTSELAVKAKNHFGIKCGSVWKGPSYAKIDDEKGPDGKPKQSCFRVYDDPYGSYMDHSAFLQANRYKSLYALPQDDYKGWARGLQKAGYATNPKYADKLIDIIQRYDLHKYDKSETKRQAKNSIVHEGKRRAVVAIQGETLSDIARLHKMDAVDLAKINNWRYPPLERLQGGEIIYLDPEPTRKQTDTGPSNQTPAEPAIPTDTGYHTVVQGDTLFSLSRRYQTTVENIKKLNNLRDNTILVGQRLRVR
jgi:LysM repeat protein